MKKRERTRTASLGQRGLARRVGSVSVPRLGHGAALCRTVTLREHGAERTRGLFQPRGSRHLCLEKRVLWKEKLEGGDQLHPAPSVSDAFLRHVKSLDGALASARTPCVVSSEMKFCPEHRLEEEGLKTGQL